MRLRRSVPAAFAATLALSLLGAAPASSNVDDVPPVITAVKVTPATVLLTAAAGTKVTVDVTATDNVQVTNVAAVLWQSKYADWEVAPYFVVLDTPDFTQLTGTDVWRGSAVVPRALPAGRYKVMAFAYDAAGHEVETPAALGPFVKRDTKLTLNAGPEPVRKGATLKATGALSLLKQSTGTYVPFAGRQVALFFTPKGATRPKYMGMVTTNTYGKFTRSFTATADGTWQARYVGTHTFHAKKSVGDYVDVL